MKTVFLGWFVGGVALFAAAIMGVTVLQNPALFFPQKSNPAPARQYFLYKSFPVGSTTYEAVDPTFPELLQSSDTYRAYLVPDNWNGIFGQSRMVFVKTGNTWTLMEITFTFANRESSQMSYLLWHDFGQPDEINGRSTAMWKRGQQMARWWHDYPKCSVQILDYELFDRFRNSDLEEMLFDRM